MSIVPNLDEMTDEEKLNVLESVQKSIADSKEIQKQKIAANVDLVVQALKKIESDIRSRFDDVGFAIEKRVSTIKDGRDGADGRDGRNGKDGKNGRDGATGPRGADGKNGLDGADGTDGVSVANAHIDFDGSLVISLSSGQEINVGEVVAPALAEQIKVITNGGGTSQSVIDTLASLQAQITALGSSVVYGGLWNASTNTPTLVSSVGTSGTFYIVSVAGTTSLNGISNWGVGDWAIFNGTVWQRVEGGADGNFTTLSASSTVTFSGLTASTALALDASKNVVSVTNTGSGSNVLATSPTLVTPVLGTPSSGTLTNCTFPTLNQNTSGTAAGLSATLVATSGGTGQSSYAVGDILYASTTTALSKLADVATGNAIISGGIGVAPSYGKIALTTHVSGTLPVANGGTGVTAIGTGVATALGVNTGSAGAFVVNGGALGTPSGGTVTNLTGTASININGTVGATTPSTGAFTTVTATGGVDKLTNATGVVSVAASAAPSTGQVLTATSSTVATWQTPSTTSAATPTVLGTVYGSMTTSGGSPYLTALGYNAGVATTGASCTAVGVGALQTNTTGARNTAVGYQALNANTTISDNTAVGYQAGLAVTTGDGNTLVGLSSGKTITTGYNNTFVGASSGQLCTATSNNNTAVGFAALYAAAGNGNSAFGNYALNGNTAASNSAFGNQALYRNTSGAANSAFGNVALNLNTTGANNTAVGTSALEGNTTNSYNVGIGSNALATGGGNDNIAIGYQALYTEGATGNGQNVAIGSGASKVSTASAYNNVCVGFRAGYVQTTGVANVIVGAASGAAVTTGGSVTIVGQAAGATLATGNGGTYIGASATASSSSVANEIVICHGFGATGKGASTGYIYPNGGGVYQGNNSANWSTTSDQRLKKNIVDNNVGLDAITSIRVRNFEYRLPEEVTELPAHTVIEKVGVQLGVIAQELQLVLPECVKTESTGVMSVDADNLTWYMVNAIKELKAEFDAYKSTHP
jgi:hypothetical protein